MNSPLDVLLHKKAVKYIPETETEHEGLLYDDGSVLTIEAGDSGYARLTLKAPTPITELAAQAASNGHRRKAKTQG